MHRKRLQCSPSSRVLQTALSAIRLPARLSAIDGDGPNPLDPPGERPPCTRLIAAPSWAADHTRGRDPGEEVLVSRSRLLHRQGQVLQQDPAAGSLDVCPSYRTRGVGSASPIPSGDPAQSRRVRRSGSCDPRSGGERSCAPVSPARPSKQKSATRGTALADRKKPSSPDQAAWASH